MGGRQRMGKHGERKRERGDMELRMGGNGMGLQPRLVERERGWRQGMGIRVERNGESEHLGGRGLRRKRRERTSKLDRIRMGRRLRTQRDAWVIGERSYDK